MSSASMRATNGGGTYTYWKCRKCGACRSLIKWAITSHCKSCSGDKNNYDTITINI